MISIDIGLNYVFIADVLERKRLSVKKSKVIELKQPLIRDSNTFDAAGFLAIIKEELKEYKEKRVAVTISGIPIASNELFFPYTDNETERYNMVSTKVFQTLSNEKYYLDYNASKRVDHDGIDSFAATTYILNKDIVNGIRDAVAKCGKKPIIFGVPQNNVFILSNTLINQSSFIIANVSMNQISMHLINKPGNIISRLVDYEADQISQEDAQAGFAANIGAKTIDEISKLMQYQTIKYPERKVEGVFVTGASANPQLIRLISESLGIGTKFIGETLNEFTDVNSLYAVSCVLTVNSKNPVNFFNKGTKKPAEGDAEKDNSTTLIVAVIIIISILVNVGVSFAIYSSTDATARSLTTLQADYTMQQQNLSNLAERLTDGSGTEIIVLERNIATYALMQDYVEDDLGFTSQIYNDVLSVKTNDITIASMTYNIGTITVDCKTQNNDKPSEYIHALEQTGFYESVSYKGFIKVGETGEVLFPVTCVLKNDAEGLIK